VRSYLEEKLAARIQNIEIRRSEYVLTTQQPSIRKIWHYLSLNVAVTRGPRAWTSFFSSHFYIAITFSLIQWMLPSRTGNPFHIDVCRAHTGRSIETAFPLEMKASSEVLKCEPACLEVFVSSFLTACGLADLRTLAFRASVSATEVRLKKSPLEEMKERDE
jgi:hypothetical protein